MHTDLHFIRFRHTSIKEININNSHMFYVYRTLFFIILLKSWFYCWTLDKWITASLRSVRHRLSVPLPLYTRELMKQTSQLTICACIKWEWRSIMVLDFYIPDLWRCPTPRHVSKRGTDTSRSHTRARTEHVLFLLSAGDWRNKWLSLNNCQPHKLRAARFLSRNVYRTHTHVIADIPRDGVSSRLEINVTVSRLLRVP